jgi:predicted Zn-dependent protease
MEYRNPPLPEGINTSKVHPLREFALLSLAALVLVGALAVGLGYFGGQLSRRLISVETETAWADSWLQEFDGGRTPPSLRRYIDGLGEKVQAAMALPEGMRVKLVYCDDDTVNAFATLGGTIILHRGLLKKIPHENALVMLVSHELAHIKSRDPIVSFGNAIGIQAVLSLFLNTDATPLQEAGRFTRLSFSRDMEQAADVAALQTVAGLYGHVSGAEDLFRIIRSHRRKNGDREPPAFLDSHPLDQARIDAIERIARERGWRSDLPTTPLPAQFKSWLDVGAAVVPKVRHGNSVCRRIAHYP